MVLDDRKLRQQFDGGVPERVGDGVQFVDPEALPAEGVQSQSRPPEENRDDGAGSPGGGERVS